MKIQNFMCFDEEEFDFTKFKGLNHILGVNYDIPGSKNGTGKSTILSALTFGIYGETIKPIVNVGIPNRKIRETKETLVNVKLITDGAIYEIVNGINKYGAGYCTVTKNGEDKTQSSKRLTHKYIEEEVVKMPISTFLRTVILTMENFEILFSMPKQLKKKFMEDVFNLTLLGSIYDLAHKDNLELNREIIKVTNNLELLERNIADITSNMSNFEDKKKQSLELLFNELTKNIEEAKKIFSKAGENYEETLKIAKEKNEKAERLLDSVDKDIRNIHLSSERNKNTIDIKNKYVGKFNQILEVLCDDCASTIKTKFDITKTTEEIQGLTKELESLQVQLNGLSSSKDKIEKLIENYESKYSKLDILNKTIASLNEKYKNELTKENPFNALLSKNLSEKEFTNKSLSIHSDTANYLSMIEYIFSEEGVKKYIVDNLIPMLNDRVKTYLAKTGAKYTCIFDNNFNFTFITETGECEFNNFSNGERCRINVSTLFAMKDLLINTTFVNTNLMFVDEFLDSALDDLAIKNIIKILREYINNYNQTIFVISHRESIKEEIFDSKILVEMRDSIAKISVC